MILMVLVFILAPFPHPNLLDEEEGRGVRDLIGAFPP